MGGFPRMEGWTRIHNKLRDRMGLLLHHKQAPKIMITLEEMKIMLEKKLTTPKARSGAQLYRTQTS